MADEKWEDWQEHSVSEPIVLAKAGQIIDVFGIKYTLKKDFVACLEKWKYSKFSDEFSTKLNIIDNGEFVYDVYNIIAVDRMLKSDENHIDVVEIAIKCLLEDIRYILRHDCRDYIDDVTYVRREAERAIGAYKVLQSLGSYEGKLSYGCNKILDEWMKRSNPIETTP